MRPYRSGKYVVGNRFLMDLETGEVTFHCRKTMRLLASKMRPEAAAMPAGNAAAGESDLAIMGRRLTEEERLAAWLPAIQAALAKPAPAAGCQRSQADPFWGTGAEAADAGPVVEQRRIWTEADEELFQLSETWACYAAHLAEGGAG